MAAGKVLIVDDEHLIRTLMADILCRDGFQVVVAENGIEALQVLQDDPGFVLVISDIHMPGMDGIGLLRALREDYAHIPVLMTSVHLAAGYVEQLMAEGAVYFLPRPFSARQLVDAVHQALAGLA